MKKAPARAHGAKSLKKNKTYIHLRGPSSWQTISMLRWGGISSSLQPAVFGELRLRHRWPRCKPRPSATAAAAPSRNQLLWNLPLEKIVYLEEQNPVSHKSGWPGCSVD